MPSIRGVGVRIVVGATLSSAIALVALGTWSGASGEVTTVYAIDATPSPALSAAQQTSDQITSVSQQITQATQDPSLSVDSKVQLINSLSAQFNQLVNLWQQQVAQTLAQTTTSANPVPQATPPAVAGVQAMSPPNALLPASPSASPTAKPTADQLRAQINSVSQQMAQVSQNSTLSPDAKNAQLVALSTQFNQLIAQLQQLGG